MERVTGIPWQVEVVIDGFLYWLATDRIITSDDGFMYYNLIISFDMISEEFREVNLPNSLAHQSDYKLSISKLRESLVVLERGEEATSVWMMEDGVPKSFTKLFTFNVNATFMVEIEEQKAFEAYIQARIAMDGGFRSCNIIISFDNTSEEFSQVNLPRSLTQLDLSMSKLRESLVVLERIGVLSNPTFAVWMMEDGAFTRLFTVNVNTPNASVKGFRKSGAPIVELVEPEYDHTLLIVYEPYSKHIDNLRD
ncbi:hypothetical protein L1987_46256 [Smallanthus sonchifolius]|uniref:Uncharacterized protein n=1 Tax=Smallanthus sonchifolius TaxID=185202 RepID=A0ACB9G088_9ASTR|nr:hypothetical protein L1987_46256 [Smallanthus sonchifolius]